MYQKRPSEILGLNDKYVSYCLDEAVTEFIIRLQNEEKPKFKNENREDNPGLKMLLG